MSSIVDFINNIIWSKAMIVMLVGTGIIFSMRLSFFQFTHHSDLWRNIFNRNNSQKGISQFASFCTTMAARIGTGNVAGVAVAIYLGGPGALFWMWVVGITNSALSFVECTLGQLYKVCVDGEYRGSGAHCAERGLGWKRYAKLMSFVMMIGAAIFMPAAATYTICDSFYCSWNVPYWISSLGIALLFGIIIIGGIRRIGKFASYIVPFMTVAYLIIALAIILINISEIPSIFELILKSAFGLDAISGGIQGGIFAAILNGVKRGTFSSAAGMGESTPAASAAETTHPIKQGMANAAGVFLDTLIVCSATGFMILLTNCYNTAEEIGGYATSVLGLKGATGGIIFVQEACRTILGSAAPSFISVTLFFFSFTCIISYYYESETAALQFLDSSSQVSRRNVTWLIRIAMTVLIFVWGIADSKLAWNVADLALGLCTWINVLMLWFLFPRVLILYKDYLAQKSQNIDPVFRLRDRDENWGDVDREIWS